MYGHRGWIGEKVCGLLVGRGHHLCRGEARVDDRGAVEAEIQTHQPSHVVCLIGRTSGTIDGKEYPNIDYLEQPGKVYENVRDNLFGPMILALLASRYGFHLTYMGTGCIFKYDGDHPTGDVGSGFGERDRPNFFGSSYSIVKGFTDELMKMETIESHVLNVRIRMPITAERHPKNFITKITQYKKVIDVPNSMTVLDEMLPYLVDLLERRVTGTINFVNPGVISHNEILQLYRETVDPTFTWENFTVEELRKVTAGDRSNNCLDTTHLSSLYPQIKHIKDSVREVLVRMREVGGSEQ